MIFKKMGHSCENGDLENKIGLEKHRKAFTLVELLVVSSMIAVLSVVIFVSYSSVKVHSRNAKRIESMDSIRTALGIYKEVKGEYPRDPATTYGTTVFGVGAGQLKYRSECNGWPPAIASDSVIPGLVPQYLERMPQDPLMETKVSEIGVYNPVLNDKYCYIYISNGKDYAFMLHSSNDGAASEIDWLSKPELVDPARSSVLNFAGLVVDVVTTPLVSPPADAADAGKCKPGWVMPTEVNQNLIHAWKIYSEGAKCW